MRHDWLCMCQFLGDGSSFELQGLQCALLMIEVTVGVTKAISSLWFKTDQWGEFIPLFSKSFSWGSF
jgi:hypothetical protein